MSENNPPHEKVAIGNYAFYPPFVPTELQLEQAEEFVFTHPAFERLQEDQRRRNVIRLAIAAASNSALETELGPIQDKFVLLFGGVAHLHVEQHEGVPVISYQFFDPEINNP